MSKFSLFPLLPAELRNMVWEEALPRDFGTCLFPYRPGLWKPRKLSPGDEHFDTEEDTLNLLLEFHLDTLDPIRINLPLAFINHEARHVALDWLRRNYMKLLPYGEHPLPLAVRAFQYERDILFIPPDKWRAFAWELINRHQEPDLRGRSVTIRNLPLRNIAVMQKSVAEEHPSDWLMMFQTYGCTSKMFVITEEMQGEDDADWQDHLDYSEPAVRWCELGVDPRMDYTWNDYDLELKHCSVEEKEGEGFSAIAGPMISELREWLVEDEYLFDSEFGLYRARVAIRRDTAHQKSESFTPDRACGPLS